MRVDKGSMAHYDKTLLYKDVTLRKTLAQASLSEETAERWIINMTI